MTIRIFALAVCFGVTVTAQAPAPRDLRKTALASASPSSEIARLDIDGDGKPDIIERWWNGKRVRWLDENGDLLPTDTRGDQVADVLQVDMNGDGIYDGVTDQNIKWADNDGDGRPDVQAWATQPPAWGDGEWSTTESHWMLFLDVGKDGVLGWQDWQTFNFGDSNWDYTNTHDWLPDYHGDGMFLKIHRPPQALPDPRLNWENPFAFYDIGRRRPHRDGDAVAGPDAAGRQGHGAALGRPERGLRHVRRRQRLRQGQRDRLRHVAARRGRSRCAVPVNGHEVPGPARQPEVRQVLPVGQLAADRRAEVHAARQELRLVLHGRLDVDVLRLRRRRRRPPVGTGGDVLPDARVRRARGHRPLVGEEMARRPVGQLREALHGGGQREAGPQRPPAGRFARRPRRVRPRQLRRREALRRRVRSQTAPRRGRVGRMDGGQERGVPRRVEDAVTQAACDQGRRGRSVHRHATATAFSTPSSSTTTATASST